MSDAARRSVGWSMVVIAVVAMLSAIAWADDFITLQGERTVYTASCDGQWQGKHCAGRLRPAERAATSGRLSA